MTKKIELVQSEAWTAYYSIFINGEKFGHFTIEQDGCYVYVCDGNEKLHCINLRFHINEKKRLLSLVKSFVSFIVDEGGIDLSFPEL